MDNLLIIVDLEGIIGVEDLTDDNVNEDLLAKEIKIILNSIDKKANIYLCYDHNNGILPGRLEEKLNKDINVIRKIRNIDLNLNYNMAFLIGFHGKKKDKCKFPHAFRDEIESLFLGEKEVGEIEMVINLLSYYKIPVTLISTEGVVINYLPYDCIYHNISEGNEQFAYENLKESVKKGLEHSIKPYKYNDSKVKIKYDDYTLRKGKGLKLDIKTAFEDTIDFFQNLQYMHIPLNRIIKEETNCLLKKIIANRPKSMEIIKDEGIRELLKKDIKEITYFELCIISAYFERYDS